MEMCLNVGNLGYPCEKAATHTSAPLPEDQFHEAVTGTTRLMWTDPPTSGDPT